MSQLQLKRNITIKAIVTPLWKEEAQKQLQNQINQVDSNLQKLEVQGQRVVSEVQKQNDNPDDPGVKQQIASVQNKLNQDKSKLLQQKNQFLQQLQTVQTLELDKEVNQGQMESFFMVGQGDNLIKKMQVEILLRDGVIEDIRGEI
ncbi:MAG: YlqD family protein [Cyanobacteria bacterium J06638_28]